MQIAKKTVLHMAILLDMGLLGNFVFQLEFGNNECCDSRRQTAAGMRLALHPNTTFLT
jgi:hypothetical protein